MYFDISFAEIKTLSAERNTIASSIVSLFHYKMQISVCGSARRVSIMMTAEHLCSGTGHSNSQLVNSSPLVIR